MAAAAGLNEERIVRRLALSRGVTFFGGNASFWALSAILYQQSLSPTLVAAAALASFSVPAALSPIAGLLGDHFDRRRVMVASELSGAIVFAVMAVVSAPAALLGLRVLASVAAAPLVPTTSAALPSLVADEKLDEANASLSKAGTAGCLIGTAVAGLMLATVGGSWVFALNTITFLISACLILATKGDFRPARSEREGGMLSAGFSFLRHHATLRPVTIAYGIIFLGVGITLPAEIVVATDFGAGSIGYAGLVFLWGIGMLAGAAAGERWSSRSRQVIVLALADGAVAAGFLAVSVAPIFAVALLGMAFGGLGEGLWQVAQNSLIQRRTPDGVRSRVLAGSEAAMQGGIAIGLLVSGFIIGTLGASGAFAVAAGAAGSATLLLLAFGLRTAADPDVTPPNSRLAEARDGTPRRNPDGAPFSPGSGRRPVSPTPAEVTSTP